MAAQPKPETRTAREVEHYAATLDFLRAIYRVECIAGIEGPASVVEAVPWTDNRPCPRPDHAMFELHTMADHRA